LIKPILLNEYDGSADAEKYHCFVLQYCKEGHVPEDKRVFLLPHYLTGKAHSFFTQKVSKNHEQWKLKDFFEELFNFCFPMNYRSLQRKKIKCCYQNDCLVSEYTFDLSNLFSMVAQQVN
ncbi:hypothetical protein F5879DRAFT_767320, partial [Lentinula edodes]